MMLTEKCGIKYERLLQMINDSQFEGLVPPIYPIPKKLSASINEQNVEELYHNIEKKIGGLPWIVRSSGNEDGEEINAGKYLSVPCYSKKKFHEAIISVSECLMNEGRIDAFVQKLIYIEDKYVNKDFVSSGDSPYFLKRDIGILFTHLEKIHAKFPDYKAIDCEWCLCTNFGIVSVTSNTSMITGKLEGEINFSYGLFGAQKCRDSTISGTYIIDGNISEIWFGDCLVETRINKVFLVQVRPVVFQLFYDVFYKKYEEKCNVELPIKNIIVNCSEKPGGKYIYAPSLDDAWNKYVALGDVDVSFFFVENGSPLEHAGLMCRRHSISVFVLESIPELFLSYNYCSVNLEDNVVMFYLSQPNSGNLKAFSTSVISPRSFFVQENLNAYGYQYSIREYFRKMPPKLYGKIVENTEQNDNIIVSDEKTRFYFPCGVEFSSSKNNDVKKRNKIIVKELKSLEDCILLKLGMYFDISLLKCAKEVLSELDCKHLKIFSQNLSDIISNCFLTISEKETITYKLLHIITDEKYDEILSAKTISADIKIEICDRLCDKKRAGILKIINAATLFREQMWENEAVFINLQGCFFNGLRKNDSDSLEMFCMQLIYFSVIENIDSQMKIILKDIVENESDQANLQIQYKKGLKMWAEIIRLFDQQLGDLAIRWLTDNETQQINSIDISVIDYFSEEFTNLEYDSFCESVTNAHQLHNLLHQKSLYYFQLKGYPYLNSFAKQINKVVNMNTIRPNVFLAYTNKYIEANIGLSMHKASIKYYERDAIVEYSEALGAETPTRLIIYQWILNTLSEMRGTLTQRNWITKECGVWKIYIKMETQCENQDEILQDFIWFTYLIKLIFDMSYDFSGVDFGEVKIESALFKDKRWINILEEIMHNYVNGRFVNDAKIKTSTFSHFLTWICMEQTLADFTLEISKMSCEECIRLLEYFTKGVNSELIYNEWKELYLRKLITEFIMSVKYGKEY